MYIHLGLKFGCPHCIRKRGKLYDNEIDFQMDNLKDVIKGIGDLFDSKHDISDEASDYIMNALDKLDDIRFKTLEAIGKNTSVEQTEMWNNGR